MTKQTCISTLQLQELNIKKIKNIYLFIYLFILLISLLLFLVVLNGNVGGYHA